MAPELLVSTASNIRMIWKARMYANIAAATAKETRMSATRSSRPRSPVGTMSLKMMEVATGTARLTSPSSSAMAIA